MHVYVKNDEVVFITKNQKLFKYSNFYKKFK